MQQLNVVDLQKESSWKCRDKSSINVTCEENLVDSLPITCLILELSVACKHRNQCKLRACVPIYGMCFMQMFWFAYL